MLMRNITSAICRTCGRSHGTHGPSLRSARVRNGISQSFTQLCNRVEKLVRCGLIAPGENK